MKAAVKDDDGIPLRHGDYITFSFGIPPISVALTAWAAAHGEKA